MQTLYSKLSSGQTITRRSLLFYWQVTLDFGLSIREMTLLTKRFSKSEGYRACILLGVANEDMHGDLGTAQI
jgi:hypothetical protein